MTGEILQRMSPQAVLVAIELNHGFVSHLQRQYEDPRLNVVHGTAADVREILQRLRLPAADFIISGIPYTTIPDPIRRRILHDSRDVLSPDGAFVVYQFTRTVLPYLTTLYGRVQQHFEPRNILPARLFFCRA